MSVLRYKPRAQIEDLALGECTVHRCTGSDAARWWLLWFYVLRDSDGQPEVFGVPINPLGSYMPSGPGGRTWGVSRASEGDRADGMSNWLVSPSINVLDSGSAVDGAHPSASLWHQTPEIVNVPDDEPWAMGAAP